MASESIERTEEGGRIIKLLIKMEQHALSLDELATIPLPSDP